MTQRRRMCGFAALFFIIIGISFAFVPGDWIEWWIGIDPDGGNGLLEFSLIALPLAIGLVLAIIANGSPINVTSRPSTNAPIHS